MGYNQFKQKIATALVVIMSMSATLSVTAATTSILTKISSSATLRTATVSDLEASKSTSSNSGGGGRSSSATRESTMNGKWVAENGVWKFLKDNGEYATNAWGYIKGHWYFFDAQGNMVTGWYLVNDQWYYMNPAEGSLAGAMLTGWVMDSNYGGWFYLNATGAMVTGWNEINGKWYYLHPISDGTKGIMAANTYVDGYYVGADGAWVR